MCFSLRIYDSLITEFTLNFDVKLLSCYFTCICDYPNIYKLLMVFLFGWRKLCMALWDWIMWHVLSKKKKEKNNVTWRACISLYFKESPSKRGLIENRRWGHCNTSEALEAQNLIVCALQFAITELKREIE